MASSAEKVEFFTCIVCSSYMFPPIYQCPGKHVVCGKCNSRIDSCTFCRGPKGTRAYDLERQSLEIDFPCPNASHGCRFTAKSFMMMDREAECHYTYSECPFTKLQQCNYTGTKRDLVQHLVVKHPQMVHDEPAAKLKVSGIGNTRKAWGKSMYILSAHHTTFTFYCQWTKFTDELRCSVTYYAECPILQGKFMCKLSFMHGITGVQVFETSIPCFCVGESGEKTADYEENQLCLPITEVEEYCSRRGHLHIIVSIHEISSTPALEK